MKKILALFVLSLLSTSCAQKFNLKQWKATRKISSFNLKHYPLSLAPYGFTVLSIPKLKGKEMDVPKGWWQKAVVYQVYIRSFQDSNGDGHGDLEGLISRLDDITNVGFNAIWILPVFKSYWDGSVGRALGYEAEDYRAINPYYGDLETFSKFVKESHKRGIRIIMDMVINHAATNLPAFQLSAKKDPFYRDWFIWTNASIKELDAAGWRLPWGGGNASHVWHYNETRKELFYATWGAEFNFNHAAVRKEFKNIADYWIQRGVDGFRMDAIRYLIEEGPGKGQADTPSSLSYLKEYQSNLKEKSSNVMTVGEVWTADRIVSRYYLDGKGFDQCFSFDFHYRLKESLKSGKALPLRGYLSSFRQAPQWFFSHFIDNHDVSRLITDYRNNYDKAKLAAALLLTLPGTPYVYYGDEIGQLGQYSPMAWNSDKYAGFSDSRPWIPLSFHKDPRNVSYQKKDPDSLWHCYRDLIRLRKENPVLIKGSLKVLNTGKKQVLAYARQSSEGTMIVVANFGKQAVSVELNLGKILSNSSEIYTVFGKGIYTKQSD